MKTRAGYVNGLVRLELVCLGLVCLGSVAGLTGCGGASSSGGSSTTPTQPSQPSSPATPLVYSAGAGIANNDMVYNPVNGLFYVSVPGSAGAPYGTSVVSVDPATGGLGTPILVGSEPNRMAVTSDRLYLWVGLDGASAVRQVNLTTNAAGMQFSTGGSGPVAALATIPGEDSSVVVSSALASQFDNLAIFDSGVVRGTEQSATPSALQVSGTTNEV
jgi:hypothetical protein